MHRRRVGRALKATSGPLVGAVSLLLLIGGGAPAAADIDVVASIKPVHSLVASVMQGVGEPVLLVKGTGSEHSYSLRPSAALALEQAEVVFWVGETMETFLAKPLRALASNARAVELRQAPGLTLLPTREGGMWEAHQHSEGKAGADVNHGAREHGEQDKTEDGDATDDKSPEQSHGETDMHIRLRYPTGKEKLPKS